MVAHELDVAEKETDRKHDRHPDYCADDGIGEVFPARHLCDAGDEGNEGTDDRHEKGDHDGLAAVVQEKFMGLIQMASVEQPGSRPEDPRPDRASGFVVDHVAENHRDRKHHDRHGPGQMSRAGKRTGDEDQRVAGQKKRHHKAGLGEDDQEQQRIHPQAVGMRKSGQITVQMQEKIEDVLHALMPMAWAQSNPNLGR